MFNVNHNLWGDEKAAKLLSLILYVWEREKGREEAWERETWGNINVPINAYKLFKIFVSEKCDELSPWVIISLRFHYFDEMHYVNSNAI